MTLRTLIVADRVFGHPEADAVMVEDRKVTSIGRASTLASTPVVEERFPGATILPGLIDAHFHPVGYAGALERLVLKDVPDMDALIDAVRSASSDLVAGELLIGIRLDDESLAERRLPTRAHLDLAVADRPVLLYRYCGHIAVANTAALDAAGIDASTPDPFGGSFDRDRDRTPTGVLRETAIGLVSDVIGDRARGLTPASIVEASRRLASLGLTSLGAMAAVGRGSSCEYDSEVDLLIEASASLAIPMAVMVQTMSPDDLRSAADRIRTAGRRVSFLGVKMFADGSLGGHTAAMKEPFTDRPSERGTTRLDSDVAFEVGRASLDLGGVVAIHAIGDAANASVLDIFGRLLDAGADPRRLRVEHASVLDDDDLERMATMGIVASVQPAFLASEGDWLERRVGPDRLTRTYPFASMRSAGITLAGGSDCPVEPPHPLWGLAAAVDRGGLVPAEALTIDQAVEMFTAGGAAALQRPAPLEIGSRADLTIVDGDVAAMTPAALRSADVVGTIVEGETVPPPDGDLVWPG